MKFKPNLRILENANSLSELIISIARGSEPTVITMNTKSKPLTKEEIENFGKELEIIRTEILSKVGQEDADHIRKVQATYRYNEIMGRLLIHFSMDPITFALGTSMLGISKILNNMEIGHNVMHGQYDWMNDPEFNSNTFEWDIVSDSSQWKFCHNYMDHTYTNVVGKDHDYGYHFTRLSEEQEWKPVHLFQSIANFFLAFNFEWGVGGHGYKVEYLEKPKKQRTKKTLQDYKEVYNKKIEIQLFGLYRFSATRRIHGSKNILRQLTCEYYA